MKILYEDNHLIAVWKDAGILSQGDYSGDKSIMDDVKTYIKEKYNKKGNVFLGLLHRLDRPVAGIMLFAKTSKGASRLSEQFREHTIVKKYSAIIEGQLEKKSGSLINFLEKKENRFGGLVAKVNPRNGAKAELSYKTILSNKKYSLIEIDLLTGKFHQIRAQFAEIGHPIVGDIKYGGKKSPILSNEEIALVANELDFITATDEKKIVLKVPYPEKWKKFFK
jgi:23S rRNA pseudouridine1911/1915/1917 synthase